MHVEALLYTLLMTQSAEPQPTGRFCAVSGESDESRLTRALCWLVDVSISERTMRFLRLCYLPSCCELITAANAAGEVQVELRKRRLTEQQRSACESLSQVCERLDSDVPRITHSADVLRCRGEAHDAARYVLGVARSVYDVNRREHLWILADEECGIV